MSSTSPYHIVPDMLPALEPIRECDDPFYSHVMNTGINTRVQQMDTSDSSSECSEADDKVYMSLTGTRKLLQRLPLSPLPETVLSTENIDIRSWRERHPKHWLTRDIINWIHYVCSRSDKLDGYKVRSERFNELKGDQLCSMCKQDFIQLDPVYGADLHDCFGQLLKTAQFKAPSDIDFCPLDDVHCTHAPLSLSLSNNSAMWSSTIPPEESDHEMDLSGCAVVGLDANNGRYNELDTGPGTPGVAVIGGEHYDFNSDDGFEDVVHCCGESGYGSDGSACTSPGALTAPTPPPAHSHHPSPYGMHYLPHEQHPVPRPAHAPLTNTANVYLPYQHQVTAPMVKPRGRPKRDGPPGTRGRKHGQTTKGNHLWEFIRNTINDRRYNPDCIKWENKEQGIFRIVNSTEIAKMWGRTKNNSTMTYEKFSRAMRFCRTQDFFAELPKEGNYPKKLCFRFGTKATNWAH